MSYIDDLYTFLKILYYVILVIWKFVMRRARVIKRLNVGKGRNVGILVYYIYILEYLHLFSLVVIIEIINFFGNTASIVSQRMMQARFLER